MSDLLLAIGLLIIGFVLLIKGADVFVEGSSSIATRFHIPSIIIGLTIVAMGTSLPECAVSVTASLSGNNALAVSNVVGSNIFNLMVVAGASALFIPIAVSKDTLKKEFPFSIICALLLGIFGFMEMVLGRIDGVIFLILFFVYILYMIISAKKAIDSYQGSGEEIKIIPIWKSFLFIIGGAIAIKYGGDFVVESASFIASSFGMSQNLIGLTIVALGTSLPELVTSIVAARKGEVDMALGNVIGSNIFNILLVLGVASAISPITFIFENIIDILILIIFSFLVLYFGYTKHEINKKEGIIMLLFYSLYLIYIIMR
ncbi:MAG: calcium/sodium antiporter [Faecalibacillus sp.]